MHPSFRALGARVLVLAMLLACLLASRPDASVAASFVVKAKQFACYVGNDYSLALTELDHEFVALPRDSQEVWVKAEGATRAELEIRAPFGHALRKGWYVLGPYDYTGADRIYGAGTCVIGYQGADLAGPGGSNGFEVRKLRMDEQGYARTLWATFHGGCNGFTSGEMILGADTSLYIHAPAFALAERGSALRFDVSAIDANGPVAQLACTQRPTGSSFTSGPGGTGTFEWPVTGPLGDVPVTFIANDPLGNTDTLSTLLRVMEPRLLSVDTSPGTVDTSHLRLDATSANFVVFTPGVVDLYVYTLGGTCEVAAIAPFRRALTPGVYTGAIPVMTGDPPSRWPALSVTGTPGPSRPDSGTFHVRKLAFGANGYLSQLWMTFDTGKGFTHATGEVRFGDLDTTLYLTAPSDVYANPSTSLSINVRAIQALGRPVTLTARGLPSGASLVDQGDGTGLLTWPNTSGSGTDSPITIVASDGQGRQDTCVTHVHVVVPATITTTRDPNNFGDSWAQSYGTDGVHADFQLSTPSGHRASLTVRTPGHTWWFSFSAPDGGFLVPRYYPGALGLWSSVPSAPLLDVEHDYVSCTYGAHGSFTILDVGYDAGAAITSLWATFRDSCYWNGALTGEVRYGSVHDQVTAVVDGEAPFGIGAIGPNPTTGVLQVRLGGRAPGPILADLFDVAGRHVWRREFARPDRGGSTLTLEPPSSLAAGMYLIQLRSGMFRADRRIVLAR
jgi:hypothetical protein